jgi:hypothetical protein
MVSTSQAYGCCYIIDSIAMLSGESFMASQLRISGWKSWDDSMSTNEQNKQGNKLLLNVQMRVKSFKNQLRPLV